MACARKPEAFVWTDNEVELLLRLTLDYKASKLQETRTQAVVRHCCCCCCYETLRGSAGWGDGVIVLESMRIRRPHENGRAAISDFSTLRPVLKKMHFQDPCGRSAKTMQYMCVFTRPHERFCVDSLLFLDVFLKS